MVIVMVMVMVTSYFVLRPSYFIQVIVIVAYWNFVTFFVFPATSV